MAKTVQVAHPFMPRLQLIKRFKTRPFPMIALRFGNLLFPVAETIDLFGYEFLDNVFWACRRLYGGNLLLQVTNPFVEFGLLFFFGQSRRLRQCSGWSFGW